MSGSGVQESGYAWDVFLSYSRWARWPEWIDKHFKPLFEHYLGEELARPPRIYVDRENRQPGPWPSALGKALSSARVLVPLLSRTYYTSPWCRSEYDLMKLRSEQCGCALILPAVIHDGGEGRFGHAEGLDWLDLKPFANPAISEGSITREGLGRDIGDWTPRVASAIQAAPPHDAAWQEMHVDAMTEIYEQSVQKRLPGWGQ
jgi:hypothetical protein